MLHVFFRRMMRARSLAFSRVRSLALIRTHRGTATRRYGRTRAAHSLCCRSSHPHIAVVQYSDFNTFYYGAARCVLQFATVALHVCARSVCVRLMTVRSCVLQQHKRGVIRLTRHQCERRRYRPQRWRPERHGVVVLSAARSCCTVRCISCRLVHCAVAVLCRGLACTFCTDRCYVRESVCDCV